MKWPWQKHSESHPSCQHKYKDFPWYIDAHYCPADEMLEIQIVAPYVCVICGERIDKPLKELTRWEKNYSNALKTLNNIEMKYGSKVADRAIVEDMIADMQLVDREFLKYYDMIHGKSEDMPHLNSKPD